MAEIKMQSGLVAEKARVVDSRDSPVPVDTEGKPDELEALRAWILNRVKRWRDHRRQNYELQWDQYERTWRGLFTTEDRGRKSEKSTLVTPATAEAVENIVAEVEEALFGRGDFFDIKSEIDNPEMMKKITDQNKNHLKEDLSNSDFTSNIGEALINAAVYGSGIGEIFVDKFIKRDIVFSVEQAVMQMGPPDQQTPPEMKVESKEVHFAYLQSVNPRNFLIEPTARTVDKALGVAVEEYVGAHIIKEGQKKGQYRDVDVGTSQGDHELGADRQNENEYVHDKVHIIRYYGLVPAHLLPKSPVADDEDADEQIVELFEAVEPAEKPDAGQPKAESDGVEPKNGEESTEPVDTTMVEAKVFIANESVVIKAVESPYVMKDRPIVAFPWDIVPGRFWGRGVCEKGLVPQKVLDAEMRSRIDALAYVTAPMMAMDASRLPRGFQLTVKPGKSILTNGDPKNILNPMHFGQLDQSTFQHSAQLDQMIQRATGSLDVIALASRGGDARPGAISMMLSGIVKRHKRTLMNFVDRFFVPALRKLMWRNMQFNPERYTPVNFTFIASSTMGILQREYENQILVQLLQSMEPQSKEYKILLMGVISNTGLSNRQQLITMLKESIASAQQLESAAAQQQGNPETQALQGQVAQMSMQLQLAEGQAKIKELASRANLQDAKTQNELREPLYKSMEIATKGIYQVQQQQQSQEFDRRMAVADRLLKLKDIASNERIAQMQSGAKVTAEGVNERIAKIQSHGSIAAEAVKSHGALASEAVRGRATVAAEHAKAHATISSAAVKAHGERAKAAAAKAAKGVPVVTRVPAPPKVPSVPVLPATGAQVVQNF
jgi:hypothetical protein